MASELGAQLAASSARLAEVQAQLAGAEERLAARAAEVEGLQVGARGGRGGDAGLAGAEATHLCMCLNHPVYQNMHAWACTTLRMCMQSCMGIYDLEYVHAWTCRQIQ